MPYYQSYKNLYAKALTENSETGFVTQIVPPIAHVRGLPTVKHGEIVYFESGEMGIVTAMTKEYCEVLVFSNEPVGIDCQVSRSMEPLHILVGTQYLGKSIDALGRPSQESVDMGYIHKMETKLPVERSAPGIDRRAKVSEPFETGVAVVDMMIPLGKGQRELVLGDRQTGKTEFLLQTLVTQARKGTVCIYVNIGKKRSNISHVEKFIVDKGIADNTILVSSASTDPLGMIFLTPYSAMTIAEFFVSIGRDVLLILDDLSTHAKFYREISLLARRFPGRSSYPGDIFYSHARLLERAGNFMLNDGKTCSLTCLGVAETIQSDISGYIQTNLMSITDGHIYFDHELFEQGRRPAINYFLSVTRVGRQTQDRVRWGINRELSSFLTLYEKTRQFIHFGAEVNEGIKATLTTGARILAFFDQPMGTIIDQKIQTVLFCLVWTGAITFEGAVEMDYMRNKSHKLYQSDAVFKKLIDDLLDKQSDINSLLGKISSNSKAILTHIDMAKTL